MICIGIGYRYRRAHNLCGWGRQTSSKSGISVWILSITLRLARLQQADIHNSVSDKFCTPVVVSVARYGPCDLISHPPLDEASNSSVAVPISASLA
jgi:hypothetical protein